MSFWSAFSLLTAFENDSQLEIIWKEKWKVKNTFQWVLKLMAGWRRDYISMLEASRMLTLYIHCGERQMDSSHVLPSHGHAFAVSCSASSGTWEEDRKWGVGWGLGANDEAPKHCTRHNSFLVSSMFFHNWIFWFLLTGNPCTA